MRLAHGWHVIVLLVAAGLSGAALAAPQRVVSTNLCTDEYVFRLLPRSRIAALSFLSADRHPVISTIVDRVGTIPLVHAATEEVLARRPDLVVMFAGTDARLRTQLQGAGIAVLDVPPAQTLADVRRITLQLGRALDAGDAAAALLAAMDRDLAGAAPDFPPVRTLIYEPNGYATSGAITGVLLARAGLADAAPRYSVTRQGTVPVEMLVADPPQLLILNSASRTIRSRSDLVLHHPALQFLPSRVLVARVSLTPLLCAGPWSAQTVPLLAALGRQARALARGPHRP
jgi:iron complex transport system substrate-binding protein